MTTVFGILFIILLIMALIIFGPFITIWSLNLLFGLTIPINLATWFAVFWISAIVSGGYKYLHCLE